MEQRGKLTPRKILLLVMTAGLLGCAVFGGACRVSGGGWALSGLITSAMVVYHMFIRFFAPVLLWVFFRKTYDCRWAWFQPRPWEPRLYRLLRVKRWKGRAITYDPREFSFRLHAPEEIVNNMCHAEAVHELTALLSLLSVCFAIPFGAAPVFFAAAVLAALVDLACVVIQRYNRPRLVKILERRRGRGNLSQN